MTYKRRIGVVVNPIAGMGGRVGLKGTDGKVAEARALGAKPRSPGRAVDALKSLRQHGAQMDIELLAFGGHMGAEEAREAGFDHEVVGVPAGRETSAEDTREAVRRYVEADVHLILFVGGDGTAVDVADTLAELDSDTPVLGVPAGVKTYSSVFAVTPFAAGRIAANFERVEQREINDLDEEAYRAGEVRAELKAVAYVPVDEELQASKDVSGDGVESIVVGLLDSVEAGVTYILCPGSTIGAIKKALAFDGSPLGVDIWRDGAVLVKDANEEQILAHLGERNVIVVSPIGGQGFIFGRGNQQVSPDVIRRSEVTVVASRQKLNDLSVLRVDTGDEAVDERLRGWTRVRTGRFEYRMVKIV
ncbi:MAG: ATP-NAD kinase family protein [Anaerolineae bacterium]